MVQGLQLLADAGIAMAVLTNKPTQLSADILSGLQLTRFFRCNYGGDSFPTKKPDPSGILTILRELGVPSEISAVDIQTARNAGMIAVGVTYGFGQHDPVKCPADAYVDSLVALSPLVR